jgi:sulfur carrier protein
LEEGRAPKFDYNRVKINVSTNREPKKIAIVVNGETRAVTEGQTVSGILGLLGLDGSRIAVELNGDIIRPPEWGRTTLESGAELEIVQFVGGG